MVSRKRGVHLLKWIRFRGGLERERELELVFEEEYLR